MDKDLIVIGGGPGGYVCAIRAAQLGAKVILVEKDKIGGTCLNRGCIPTKTLYREAEILNILKNSEDFGISIDRYSINVEKIQERKQGIIDTLAGGINSLLKANGVEVINGVGALKDNNTVEVMTQEGDLKCISAKNIVIATGSKPSIPAIPGTQNESVFTSEDILNFKEIPRRLVIMGGGVIGMEFASIFNGLGSEVHVIANHGILSRIDSDLSKRLTPMVKKKGIVVHTPAKVTRVDKLPKGLAIYVEEKDAENVIDADALLLSQGRHSDTDGLRVDAAGVELDRGSIKVDENYETNVKGIYAIGDVNGRNMLAHAASHQGVYVAEMIMGADPKQNHIVPSCIFTFPEIACAGITEDQAKSMGINYKTSKFMFGANGKALTLGEGEGFVKVISDGEKLLGVHIMGPHASDLIHEGLLALSNNINIADIISTIHAHPTLSEAFHEAVAGLSGESIHLAPPLKR